MKLLSRHTETSKDFYLATIKYGEKKISAEAESKSRFIQLTNEIFIDYIFVG